MVNLRKWILIQHAKGEGLDVTASPDMEAITEGSTQETTVEESKDEKQEEAKEE